MESTTVRRPWEDENGSQEQDRSLIGVWYLGMFCLTIISITTNNVPLILSSPPPPATMPIIPVVSDDLKLCILFLWLDNFLWLYLLILTSLSPRYHICDHIWAPGVWSYLTTVPSIMAQRRMSLLREKWVCTSVIFCTLIYVIPELTFLSCLSFRQRVIVSTTPLPWSQPNWRIIFVHQELDVLSLWWSTSLQDTDDFSVWCVLTGGW